MKEPLQISPYMFALSHECVNIEEHGGLWLAHVSFFTLCLWDQNLTSCIFQPFWEDETSGDKSGKGEGMEA